MMKQGFTAVKRRRVVQRKLSLFIRRRTFHAWLWLLICVGLAWTQAAWADSLFTPDKRDPQGAGLYAPHPVVLAVGDMVKIRVREKSTADVSLGVNYKDQPKSTAKVAGTGNLMTKLFGPIFDLLGQGNFSHQSDMEYKNDGKTGRTVLMDALIMATVVDVLDNGYAVIEGHKQVRINKEDQTLQIRGLIDPRDLDQDRLIESDRVADIELEYVGDGQLSKRLKPGFLTRIIDWLF